MGTTIDDVVAAYMTLRTKKAAVEADVKDTVREITAKMDKLEAWLMQTVEAMGVTSVKTPHGTAFLSTTDFASVADWPAVLDYIKGNDAFDLLERRVNKTAVREHMKADGAPVPGVTYGTKVGMNIRKPTDSDAD